MIGAMIAEALKKGEKKVPVKRAPAKKPSAKKAIPVTPAPPPVQRSLLRF